MRKEIIRLLLDLGAKDLTKEMHPNKNGKCYLKLPVANGGNISFNFDYKEYDEVSVYSKKLKINEYVPILKLKMFLFKLGFEVNKKQKYAIFLDSLTTNKMDVKLNYELGDLINFDDGLPFENETLKLVNVQKDNFNNTTFYYFKKQ